MKKMKLIYNPGAGDKTFRGSLDECIAVFQGAGFDIHIFRSMEKGDIERHIGGLDRDMYHTFVACGGDGTINIVINAMKNNGIEAKLGIIPSGTANDFATYLRIPKTPEEAAKIIAAGDTIWSDLGLVEDKYFINVCGAGLLTNISQHIDQDFKNTLGKLAYYIKGIEQVQNFVPMPIRVTNSREVIEDEVYLLLVLNSAGAGSFERLAPRAKIDDGLFDFIAIKARPITEIAVLFLKILTGDYLDDSNVIFFQDKQMTIESLSVKKEKYLMETDLDGELGPDMPVTVLNVPKAIEIYAERQK